MTRREMLFSSVAVSMVGTAQPGFKIVSGLDLLSMESAAGFRAAGGVARGVARGTVFAAALRLPIILGGSLVVVECGPDFAGDRFQPGRYVQFTWPARVLIRSFGPAVAFGERDGEPIASSAGRTVAVRRGSVVVLGAMLGPHLFGGDREAHELWNALLVRCAGKFCGDTSTAA
jgi:hypothetical protein